jgi:PleD family two-component response regulator
MLPQIEVNQLADLKSVEVKAALEYAANIVRQQTNSPIASQFPVSSENSDLESPELDLKKILVVDDMPENRLLLEYMFKESGYTLSLAVDAKEALAKARTELRAATWASR